MTETPLTDAQAFQLEDGYGEGVMSDFARELEAKLAAIKALASQQAEDEGLWFMAESAPEAYLQAALRALHAEIEKWK